MSINDDEIRILAPVESKRRFDRVARLSQENALRTTGARLSRRQALGLGAMALLVAGCGGGSSSSSTSSGGGAKASGLAGKPLESDLLIYNFSEYVDPKDIKAFMKANAGTTVKETYYSSTDEMEAKVKAGGGDYDIIVPGQNSIPVLGQGGHLYELDHELLPNLKNLQPQWRGLEYDKENTYSVVKNWGYTGFFYRNDVLDEQPKTMMEFFELLPTAVKKGRTNMLEGTTLVIGSAMIALGLDPDSENPADYDKAVKFLQPLAKSIKTLDASTVRADGAAGRLVLSQGWSTDMTLIASENKNVTAVAPDGPAERWADNWSILADAKHPVAAHAWINYMLDPKVALREMKYTGAPTPVAPAWDLPGAEKYRDNPLVNVPQEKLNNYKFILSPSPKVLNLRQQAYEKFRATR
ncbi:spermidine/putrescine ABC transporter substrate-binding protein [Patulibacter sp. SYSU D01012]|uniref:ABC transporter substrate-binding protein n=1 Tax=Patulibacter sp. SYSU D01012 TaxID=2817381 RepID=UPI001B30E346|nr:spermidine/putrescine ABC transporter substrate-binding protein [Patulibacter sp. SYSU D01012]